MIEMPIAVFFVILLLSVVLGVLLFAMFQNF